MGIERLEALFLFQYLSFEPDLMFQQEEGLVDQECNTDVEERHHKEMNLTRERYGLYRSKLTLNQPMLLADRYPREPEDTKDACPSTTRRLLE